MSTLPQTQPEVHYLDRWDAHQRAMTVEGNAALDRAYADEHPRDYSLIDAAYADGWSLGYELMADVGPPHGLAPAELRAWEHGLFSGRCAALDEQERAERQAIAAGWEPYDYRGGSWGGHPADFDVS